MRTLVFPGAKNGVKSVISGYLLYTGYLLSFVSVTKYYYLPIRP